MKPGFGTLPHMRKLLPSWRDWRHVRKTWRADLVAGITVGIVALPLALAFGVSSGVGAAAGLITAVVAGIIAAVFGGSHVQVSGPTGAMVVILAPIVAEHGVSSIMLLSILAGIILVISGVLGLGKAISLIPWSVVEGFTLGIATIIAMQQVPLALGVSIPAGHSTLQSVLLAFQAALWPTSIYTLGIVASVVVLILATEKIAPKLPASLMAVIVSSIAVWLIALNVPVIGKLPHALPAPSAPTLSLYTVEQLIPTACAVAMLAGIESLLSARVAAGMPGQGSYHPDRELVGQGLASIGAGVFGGMPATGAIARTAVNVKSGARSRLAAVTHAIVLLCVVYFVSPLVSQIPLATLAGVLFVTATRMVSPATLRKVTTSTRSDMVVFWMTALVTVTFDLIQAIIIGVLLAAVLAIRHLSRMSGVVRLPLPIPPMPGDEHIALLRLDGSMFFGVADRVAEEIGEYGRDIRVVVFSMSHVGILDASGANALADVISRFERQGIVVYMKGLRPEHLRTARNMKLFGSLPIEDHLFETTEEAVARARQTVQEYVANH